jgi:hypothetical protein
MRDRKISKMQQNQKTCRLAGCGGGLVTGRFST